MPRRDATVPPSRALGRRREEDVTPLTDAQKHRVRQELRPLLPRLAASSPPERAKLIREALEHAAAMPTWEEWDAYARETLGDDAARVCSGTLRP